MAAVMRFHRDVVAEGASFLKGKYVAMMAMRPTVVVKVMAAATPRFSGSVNWDREPLHLGEEMMTTPPTGEGSYWSFMAGLEWRRKFGRFRWNSRR
jgi:hypothetical protein